MSWKNPSETINLPVEVSKQRVSDLLVSAFEGGSNYWYLIEEFIQPSDPMEAQCEYRHAQYPCTEDGAVVVSNRKQADPGTDDFVKMRLDWKRCKEALVIMAEKYPRKFADWRDENDDADTADCFLQCAIFGEEVYG